MSLNPIAAQVHLKNRPCGGDLNLREVAFETQRYSGAQLANLVNIAASFVGRDGRDTIMQADLLHVRPLAPRNAHFQLLHAKALKNVGRSSGPEILARLQTCHITPVKTELVCPIVTYFVWHHSESVLKPYDPKSRAPGTSMGQLPHRALVS